MNEDIIWIGNDHGGYELKLEICKLLEQKGIMYRDVGCDSTDIVRYPYYAAQVASAVATGAAKRGILICSTGNGMAMMANKFKGIRATLCTSTFMGKMARKHNDSNILCLGGKITGLFEALDITETWLDTEFEGGRHCISLDLIEEAEETLCAANAWQSDQPMR